MSTAPAVQQQRPLVALVGNPNVGKTLLFNRLTGQNARVGNYPGVTVERRVSRATLGGQALDLVDVPGAYSLSARSAEELVALRATLGWEVEAPDLVVVVVDATQLLRNLYLAVQLRELGGRLVVALNLVDELEGEPPDMQALADLLGVHCVPVSARQGTGLEALGTAVSEALAAPPTPPLVLSYPPEVEEAVAAVQPTLPAEWQGGRGRALALWALLSVDPEDELGTLPAGLRAAATGAHGQPGDLDLAIVSARYAWLEEHRGLLETQVAARTVSERLDSVLLHPVVGFAVFLAVMVVLFQSLFAWADPLIGVVEWVVGLVASTSTAILPDSLLTDLWVQGIVGGVGNVIVFLPQILLLFLFVGVLEDSGYMARAAYLMDRIMRACGLHGRAFVPMMSGFACAVPAIMATRTMERQRDRLLTMMVVPLMTCSARLPVYTLVIAALFPPSEAWGGWPVQGMLMAGMYLFSVGVALVAAAVLGRTILRGPNVPFVMELPPLRLPSMRNTLRMMWSRSRMFLSEAGSVILVCTILLWGLLSFPQVPEPAQDAPPEAQVAWQTEQLQSSYAGRMGRLMEPTIEPLGFDWKIGVGLIGAFAAREVFVSTLGVVYGMGDEVDEESIALRDRMRAETRADGSPAYTPLVGLSLMVFFALACQCMSTLAVVKRETRGYAWPAFLFVYMTALAWVCSFVVYQGGMLLGLG